MWIVVLIHLAGNCGRTSHLLIATRERRWLGGDLQVKLLPSTAIVLLAHRSGFSFRVCCPYLGRMRENHKVVARHQENVRSPWFRGTSGRDVHCERTRGERVGCG